MPPPKVFLSYARANLDAAEELARALRAKGIDTFLDKWNIEPGANSVLKINNELGTSDYYVLLWSAAAEGRYWVETEWAAALVREERLRKSFLFIVRLDDSDLPTLLAPRQYLDAVGSGSHNTVAEALAGFWLRDDAVGVYVMPAPKRSIDGTHPSIRIYARNRPLDFACELTVPQEPTGRELRDRISAELELPTEQTTAPGGRVGLRFTYQFLLAGVPIATDATTPVRLTDGSIIDIAVRVEQFGPDGSVGEPALYLPTRPSVLASATMRFLFMEAFRNLLP